MREQAQTFKRTVVTCCTCVGTVHEATFAFILAQCGDQIQVLFFQDRRRRASRGLSSVQWRGHCSTPTPQLSQEGNGRACRRALASVDRPEWCAGPRGVAALLHLTRVLFSTVACAERMRELKVRKRVQDLMDEEFDDDYIQTDGKLFLEAYLRAWML